jgi:raffinose/stachyose/melibiose transport system permease protein
MHFACLLESGTTMVFKKIGLTLLYTFLSLIAIIILPFFSVAKFFANRLNLGKKAFIFDFEKKRGVVATFLIKHWFSDSESAQNNRVFVWFLFPSLGSFILFVFVPFISGMYLSMTNWTGLNTGRELFLWFDNYKTIITDVRFGYSFFRTVLYSILNIVVINVVAFSLALLVTQNLKLKNVYRAGFFMPNLIGGLVLGYIWQFIFNRALVQVGGIFNPSLLINGESALIGLIVVVTWQYAGYIMMIYIAAIQNIPQDLVEASTIDGANAIQRLKAITLPLVAQAFTVAMFLTLVTSFKQFDTVASLTQGGPATQLPTWLGGVYGLTGDMPIVQGTNLVAMNIYQEAFSRNNLGLGQAKAIVFFAILLVVSLVQVYFNKKREVEL